MGIIGVTRLLCLGVLLAIPNSLAASDAERPSGDRRDQTAGQLLSHRLTESIVTILSTDSERCAQADAPYRAECFKWVFRRAWHAIDGNRSYHAAQMAFETADRTMEGFVRDNMDWSKVPRLYGAQIYRAVSPEAQPQTESILTTLVDDVTAALLAAPEQAGDHYARIAAATQAMRPGD